ncbi:MAG: GatB/YqeY domain-containing protein [Candidatus Yanofskybacteria bacterium]|nr:GatB/YqeY domain-containing protein [Candidatus Yanofskybacteria bacterium]
MALKETLKEDMKTAFKAGDTVARTTLSMVLATIQNRELEKRAKLMKAGSVSEAEVAEQAMLTDEETLDAISSEIKKRRDSIAQYEAAGRAELAAGESAEVAVLMKYLPEQLTEEAVRALITEAIAATGASGAADMGRVMGAVAPKTKGKFDGSRVNQLVKEMLQ